MFLMCAIINLLFLIKYGIRQSTISIYVLIALFCILYYFLYKGSDFLKKRNINQKIIYLSVILGTILYLVLSHLMKDPYKLKVDRWQTIEYSLDYWLRGKYIYDTRNFMGNISSYLPGQLLFLLLFRLVGNVGYIQVASFILFCFAIFTEFKNKNVQSLGILLLFTSLSFIYEVVCKSDFISSFIIVSVFIIYWNKKNKEDLFGKPLSLGFILGIICLTRSVVVIPLILFLLKAFLEADWRKKVKFSIAFLLTAGLLMLSVLIPAGSISHIVEHSPLKMQNQSNKFILIFFLVLSVILSMYRNKSITSVFYLSSVIIFCLMLSHIIEQIATDFSFDFINITYLAAALPFAIIGYCYSLSTDKKIDFTENP